MLMVIIFSIPFTIQALGLLVVVTILASLVIRHLGVLGEKDEHKSQDSRLVDTILPEAFAFLPSSHPPNRNHKCAD